MSWPGTRNRENSLSKRTIDYTSNYWKKRADNYNKLDWVNHQMYLDKFVQAGNFKKTDVVLDIGTGTGAIAHAVSPFVKEVIGLDKSQSMLEHSNWYGNMYFIRRNIFHPIFRDDTFDKVTARHVFHHILRGTQPAMDECYRVLKKGGLMVFSEGVPPSPGVKQDYIEIFKLKEKRLTFMEKDLVALMDRAGFANIKSDILRLKKMSVRNWLANSGLPPTVQERIFDLHTNAGDYFKKAYDMVETADDCFINMKMVILTGEKI
jgi:ubiquinone/menaquinone biosynthesis C-methylase UbiE